MNKREQTDGHKMNKQTYSEPTIDIKRTQTDIADKQMNKKGANRRTQNGQIDKVIDGYKTDKEPDITDKQMNEKGAHKMDKQTDK